MNKTAIVICIAIFVFITALVLGMDTSETQRRVKFTNQNFSVNNENNEIENRTGNAKITNNGTRITNQSNNTYTKEVNVQSTQTDYYNQASNLKQQNYSSTQKVDVYQQNNNSEIDARYSELNEAMAKIKEIERRQKNPDDQYRYRNIDWNKWKSNFVNRILDDSVIIKELDSYPDGSWFYYSFIVDDSGRISNINIKSPYLNQSTREMVTALISSYAHKPITQFPQNTNRKTAKVSAVMLLSNTTTKHAKPKDFNDTEVIKYKVPH